jgi:hypothetical protein
MNSVGNEKQQLSLRMAGTDLDEMVARYLLVGPYVEQPFRQTEIS